LRRGGTVSNFKMRGNSRALESDASRGTSRIIRLNFDQTMKIKRLMVLQIFVVKKENFVSKCSLISNHWKDLRIGVM
jgi:hypothetical protein